MVTKVRTFTLIMDGSSDRILVPVVEWLLSEKLGDQPFSVQIARKLPPLREGLHMRIRYAQAMYPNDVLLVHRDSEKESWDTRLEEINQAVKQAGIASWIPIVPVRMSEAWFLHDENVIRRAAGNSSSRVALNLPPKSRWALEPDPKELLFQAIRTASGHTGRRLQKLDLNAARAHVAELVDDFAYLRGIYSFDRFEENLDATLVAMAYV